MGDVVRDRPFISVTPKRDQCGLSRDTVVALGHAEFVQWWVQDPKTGKASLLQKNGDGVDAALVGVKSVELRAAGRPEDSYKVSSRKGATAIATIPSKLCDLFKHRRYWATEWNKAGGRRYIVFNIDAPYGGA